jgi:hypothetical protein
MPPAKRARNRNHSRPPPIAGELRDLRIFDSISESRVEREAFFARAWRQKAARERGELAPVVVRQAEREVEDERVRKKSAAEAVARARRLAELMSGV